MYKGPRGRKEFSMFEELRKDTDSWSTGSEGGVRRR